MQLSALLLAVALLGSTTTATNMTSQVIYPSYIVQLTKGDDTPQGITTSPTVQYYAVEEAIEISFNVDVSIPLGATCNLKFVLSGSNNQGFWQALLPNEDNRVNFYELTTPIHSKTDTFANHAKIGPQVGVLNVQTSGGNGEYASTLISGGDVPCKVGDNQFYMGVAESQMILNWEQLSTPPDGIQYVINVPHRRHYW